MQITVKGKELITTQIEGLLVKGENNADVVEIIMPTTYGGVPISDKRFVIKMINAAGVYYDEVLEKVIEGDIIKLTWVITSPFTSVDGAIIISLSVEDDDGYELSTYTAKLPVAKSVTPTIPIAPETVLENYLQEMRMRTDQAEDYSFIAEAAKTEALASKLAAETAKTAAEAARDAAALSQADALTSKNAAAASQSAAETARTGAEAARDIAVTAADDAVVRMAAYEGGAIAVQVETNKNEISVIKNYLNSSRYGVVFSGSNPQGTRVEDAVGMTANVAVDDQIVVNDFDSIPFFNRRICCGTHDANGNFIVNAYRDEPGFAWDGTNGEVYYEETPFYWAGDMNNYVSVSAVPLGGYTLSPRFRNGTDKEYSPVFWASTVAGKPTSRAGVFADYGSVNSHMASAKLYHARAHTETMAARMSDYILQLVEFATKDVQTIMMGAANMAYGSYTAVIAETGVNRIIVSNANAANFVIGQTMSIGANADSDTVAKNRVITNISIHDASNKAITFDGAPVNIAIGNVAASRPWKNGVTNIIQASSGSIVSNSDGRYPCIWRGKVSPWAETYSAICDMLVKKEGAAAPFSYIPYYLPDPTKYAAGALTADYIRLNYETAKENGYAKTLGIDPKYPHVRLPDAVGASSTTYLSGYFYIVNDSVEIRAVIVGGHLHSGRICSPVSFPCSHAPSPSNWFRASRLFVGRV